MDGKGRVGSSSVSSFTELFGTKEPQSASSSGIFASIFPPSSKAVENSQRNRHGSPGQSVSCNMPSRERTTVFPEERVEPCHLSSSLYYGGRDVYSRPPNSQTYPVIKKASREGDDVNGNNSQDASRGNWWQGSLYY